VVFARHFGQGQHGILLAMGMGTGKSLVACLLLLGLAAKRVLISCPLRVVPVWLTQFERHVAINMVVVALDEDIGSVVKKMELAQEKLRLAEARGVPFVAVINYDSAWREPFAEWAEKQRWDLVIADEAHRIKAPGGKASMFFKRLRTKALHRVLLTGTPMPHGPMDIFAPLRFADITIFGPSFAAFRQKYAVMGGYLRKQITGFQKLDELERLMSRVTYRVGKEVLDLPPETDVTYHCDLGSEARRIYKDIEEDFVAQVRDGVVTAANAMVKVLRLQQVANGIAKTDDGVDHRIDTAKQKLLADTLEDIGAGEPVVVFCWFHLDLDAVHEAARSQDLTSMELSGRKDDLKQWQDGRAQVLAVQLQAGGEGVDFTRARYSIFYSVGYSLGKYMQARSRTHRPGQMNPVEHIHLIARNTVDVRIMRALEKRAEVIESILAEITN
jgi:SNF2 family DNA or RNA helicase